MREGDYKNAGDMRTCFFWVEKRFNAAGSDAKSCIRDRPAGCQAPEAVPEHVQQLQEAALKLSPRLLSAQ